MKSFRSERSNGRSSYNATLRYEFFVSTRLKNLAGPLHQFVDLNHLRYDWDKRLRIRSVFTSRSLKRISRRIPNWFALFFRASWTARRKSEFVTRKITEDQNLWLIIFVVFPLGSTLSFEIDRPAFVDSKYKFPGALICESSAILSLFHRRSIDVETNRRPRTRTRAKMTMVTPRLVQPTSQSWRFFSVVFFCGRRTFVFDIDMMLFFFWSKFVQNWTWTINRFRRRRRRERERRRKMNHQNDIPMTTNLFRSFSHRRCTRPS